MIDSIRVFIGTPPVGYEYLEYFGVLIMFLLIYRFVTDMFRFLSRIMTGSK